MFDIIFLLIKKFIILKVIFFVGITKSLGYVLIFQAIPNLGSSKRQMFGISRTRFLTFIQIL